ncbi:serpentine type 7TM GPCR chemoreceptor srx domain-containing protein [Ditylenchus destructor]|uniref:Serpentine type 7TM GPCR chemoreceptor srx domain-containing protein n=1 Tax=Ditylenchus destructor TaxID=166010 RepID=A0AAD4MN94_9BILA|nr:serpentine type 7TM GPCR chemoreceptor srx domain-containing protein [Ditylenchus destructor]
MNSSVEEASPLIRYFSGSVHLLLLFASTCGNVLLVAVFVKGHTQFKSVTFFVMASQMLVCDIVGLIVSFILDVPLTFSGYLVANPNSAPFPQLYIAFVDGIGAFVYVATILFAMLLALNRFCIFMAPSVDRFLFRRPNIFISISIVWGYIGFTMTVWLIYMIATLMKNSGRLVTFLISFLTVAKIVIGECFPIAMLILYFIIFAKIRYDSGGFRCTRILIQTRSISKLEKTFLIQSFIICAMYEFRYAAFYIMPDNASHGQWPYIIRLLRQSTSVLMLSIHAIVIFSSNAKVRHILLRETFFAQILHFLPKRYFVEKSTPVASIPPGT